MPARKASAPAKSALLSAPPLCRRSSRALGEPRMHSRNPIIYRFGCHDKFAPLRAAALDPRRSLACAAIFCARCSGAKCRRSAPHPPGRASAQPAGKPLRRSCARSVPADPPSHSALRIGWRLRLPTLAAPPFHCASRRLRLAVIRVQAQTLRQFCRRLTRIPMPLQAHSKVKVIIGRIRIRCNCLAEEFAAVMSLPACRHAFVIHDFGQRQGSRNGRQSLLRTSVVAREHQRQPAVEPRFQRIGPLSVWIVLHLARKR